MNKFMKKILIIFSILIAFTNLSYASFPVIEKEQIEFSETIGAPAYGNSQPIWGVLSLSFAVLSLLLLPNFSIMLILSLLSVICGIFGLVNDVNWMEIVGLILGVLMTIISASIVGLQLIFRDA